LSGDGGGISNSSGPGSAGEPSMEEILASIRRVLKDGASPAWQGPAGPALDEDVLVLDAAMMAKPPELASGTALPLATEANESGDFQTSHIASDPELSMTQGGEPADVPQHGALARPDEEMYMPGDQSEPADMSDNIEPPESLIGNDARDATKGSIGALVRSLGHERNIAVSRGGVTIEDIVREEIRPMLKAWLDTHLPTLVERIVRAEIERVVDRTQV
jgi:cell pole-organizing protein PopZ